MKESRIIGVMLMKASRVSKIHEPLYSRITWAGTTPTSMAVDSSLVVSLITNKIFSLAGPVSKLGIIS